MILPFACRIWMVALVLGAFVLAPVRAGAEGVLVFAAASLKTALDEIATEYTERTGHDVTVSYAASSVLARQIQQGAPADIFISANADWMDFLEQQGLLWPETRSDLLGNSLVLIGAAGRPDLGDIRTVHDLRAELGEGFLAMALVDAVPAGIYGKAALLGLNQWEAVQERVAQTDNVRAALALVATGAAPLGIVYRSDAQAEQRVSVVASIPTDLHPPIIYPAAMTGNATGAARAFLDHLHSDAAMVIFQEQGFSLPGG